LDVALNGRGFLAVNGPNGVLYTRNGSLQISNHQELVTSDGYTLRNSADGKPIQLTSDKPVEIAPDGTVQQDNQTLGQLEIVDFNSTNSLKKMSGSCFQNTSKDITATPATNTEVQQGKLESSNVGVPESAMRLVGVMRQFEMLQKAATMGVDMDTKAIQEVAKVG
jgi:flagellar basal-body rod protein FlgF